VAEVRKPLPVVSCTGPPCGACCEHQAGLPVTWYTVIEPDAPLPADLRREIDDTARRWNGPGMWRGPGDDAPCVWYDAATKRCRHYENRPAVCREFEVGGPECLTWRGLLLGG
jgi:Fe-S-cluster containining protein